VLGSPSGPRFGHAADRRGQRTTDKGVRSKRDLVWTFAGKRVAVRRAGILAVVAIFGLTFFGGAASAAPRGWRVEPYVEIGRGTITSTVQDVTTSVGKVFGTPIFRGTTSGSQEAASPPPPCGPDGGSQVTGSVTTTASNSSQLTFSLSGTVCESATTSSYTRYLVRSTVTVTGGTGEFTNATGGGKQFSVVTLYPTGDGTQGPFNSFLHGIIRLAA
jgi:hypothetical protein